MTSPTGQAGRDEQQPLDEIGPREHELERDPAAERVADHGARPVEEWNEIVHDRELAFGRRRVARTREVGRDGLGREQRDLTLPLARVADARMDQEHRHTQRQ